MQPYRSWSSHSRVIMLGSWNCWLTASATAASFCPAISSTSMCSARTIWSEAIRRFCTLPSICASRATPAMSRWMLFTLPATVATAVRQQSNAVVQVSAQVRRRQCSCFGALAVLWFRIWRGVCCRRRSWRSIIETSLAKAQSLRIHNF